LPTFEREPRAAKVADVAEIREMLSSSTIILTDYQGLGVKSLSSLRNMLRQTGSGYRIVKNTLFNLAAKGTAAEPLAEGLAGPTAMIYTSEDPVAACKALQDFAKAAKGVSVKRGLVDGSIYGPEQIEALAKIPPRPELYAMVVGGLQAPISGLVGTLDQLIGRLVFTLEAVAEKKAA